MSAGASTKLVDFHSETETLERDVLAGLGASPKTLPSKYLYDERGSHLFDDICELEEYYPTRTELTIMDDHVGEMAAKLGSRVMLIEYGSGSGHKTEVLLEALEEPAAYVPIEISLEHLRMSAKRLAARYPEIEILPICADYTADYELPESTATPRRRVIYFPGSTIGNFPKAEAAEFLRHVAEHCGPGGGLLIGVDLDKDRALLEPAYDDAAGVTAAFNLNLLERLNRELDANFDLERFTHRAVYNAEEQRIEMYLVSRTAQNVEIAGRVFEFAAGETICTEYSHKYTLESFAELARASGLEVEQVWMDDDRLFSVQYLTVI